MVKLTTKQLMKCNNCYHKANSEYYEMQRNMMIVRRYQKIRQRAMLWATIREAVVKSIVLTIVSVPVLVFWLYVAAEVFDRYVR